MAKNGKGSTLPQQQGVTVLPDNFTDPNWRVDKEMTDILDAEGLAYEYPRIDLDQFPENFQDQVRNTPLTASTVDQYAAAMRLGAPFPTGTVDQNLNRIDLNHRLHAARQAGLTDIVVIRVTKVLSIPERNLIAVRRNNRHGMRHTSQETNEWALKAVLDLGWTVDQAAESFNVDPSTLRHAMSAFLTAQRASTLSVESEYAGLKKTPQYQIASANLHDGPFKSVVKMLSDHPGLSASKQVEYISRVADQSSDSKQLAEVKAIHGELAPPTIGSVTIQFPDTPVSGGTSPAAGTPDPAPVPASRNGITFDDAVLRLYRALDAVLGDKTYAKALGKANGDPKGDAVKEIQSGYAALAGIYG